MGKIILPVFLCCLLFSCTKKQLKEMTITLHQPIDQQVYHKNDTVFVKADVSYEKEPKNIAFFIAMDITDGDSNFFKRTILPLKTPYTVNEYYVNEFSEETHVTVSYGKRHVKTSQIYDIETLELTFLP
ncbi:MAG: hypothetical protein K0R65_662 [Crocinitomicaceae bacterium]|jgi:deoxyinosine 3'endonuclease (endonuclease V)|nr:hypothetical protein [Crocinitomicaceae bacterium]